MAMFVISSLVLLLLFPPIVFHMENDYFNGFEHCFSYLPVLSLCIYIILGLLFVFVGVWNVADELENKTKRNRWMMPRSSAGSLPPLPFWV